METDKVQQEMNENPENFLPSYNPIGIIIQFLAAYGWWLIGASLAFIWFYNKSKPTLEKWKIAKEDAEHHKNPDAVLKKMEALEKARIKQQQKLEETAKIFQEKEKERLEKKKQDYIDRNSGESSGQKLGSQADYFPLCGPGSSRGYRPPKKSKCSGGGCGK